MTKLPTTRVVHIEAQLNYIIAGGEVRRWHTEPVLREQRVDSHSFNVAWLCYIMQGGNIRPHLLLAALAHDLPEHIFGDMPAPAKRGMAERLGVARFREIYDDMEAEDARRIGLNFEQFLTDNEKRTLKLADSFEYMLYAVRERQMGNQMFGLIQDEDGKSIVERIRSYIGQTINRDNAVEVTLSAYVNNRWERANG